MTKKNWGIFFITLVVLFISFGLFWFFKQKNTNLTNKINEVEKTEDVEQNNCQEEELAASRSAGYLLVKHNSIKELKKELSVVLSGKVEYQKNEVESKELVYEKTFEIPYETKNGYGIWEGGTRRVSVLVRKYIPGLVAVGGYEGARWNVDYDKWVGYLSGLTEKTNKVKKITAWGEESEVTPILTKKWGDLVFGIYDSSFRPSGNYDRNFVTYDSKTRQIISVVASDYFLSPEYTRGSAIGKYNDEVEEFYSSIEDALASAISEFR